jgi:hypothetical protein
MIAFPPPLSGFPLSRPYRDAFLEINPLTKAPADELWENAVVDKKIHSLMLSRKSRMKIK